MALTQYNYKNKIGINNMEKINRVSLRHERKKYSQLRKISNHNNRTGDYDKEHIDESRSHLNRELYRKHASANSLMQQLNMTIDEMPENMRPKINKNTHSQNETVVVIEMILQASPEWFETASEEQFEDWVNSNMTAIKKRFGENLLTVDLHLDETTPHFHICTAPLELANKKKRRTDKQIKNKVQAETYSQYNFNAKKLFNNKELEKNQTYFAEAVKHLGIERGVKNSKTKRTTLKEYHNNIKAMLANADLEIKDFENELNKIQLPNQNNSKYIKKTILKRVFDYAKYITDMKRVFRKLKSFKLDAFKETQQSLIFLRAEREKHLNTINELNRICGNDHENLSTKFTQMQSELKRLEQVEVKLGQSEEQVKMLKSVNESKPKLDDPKKDPSPRSKYDQTINL